MRPVHRECFRDVNSWWSSLRESSLCAPTTNVTCKNDEYFVLSQDQCCKCLNDDKRYCVSDATEYSTRLEELILAPRVFKYHGCGSHGRTHSDTTILCSNNSLTLSASRICRLCLITFAFVYISFQ